MATIEESEEEYIEEVTDEEAAEDAPADSSIPELKPGKSLKPDPEDEQLRQEATDLGEIDWIEEAFDPVYEHPQLNKRLAAFIKKGYGKLGRKLGQELATEGLSMICKTISGLSHAFVKLHLPGRALTEIALLRNFCHLRYVSLAGNHIFDITPLNELQYLMALNISDNYLNSMHEFKVHQYLKTLNVSKNFLRDLKGVVEHPYLQWLYLSYNKLAVFSVTDPKYLRELKVLELRKNKLKTFGNHEMKLPALKSLFLAQNSIDSLDKLVGVKNLEFLDLRRNKLKATGEWATPALRYLNLSWNYIEELTEIEKLAAQLPQLKTLLVRSNPVLGNERTQTHVVAMFLQLTRFNNTVVTKQLRQDAVSELLDEEEEDGSAAEEK